MTKKLRKRPSEASNKGLGGEDSNKEYNHNEEFDDERKLMNDSSLRSVLVEQIQNLVVDVLKAYLRGGSKENHFVCLVAISLLSSSNLMARVTPSSTLSLYRNLQ